MELQPKDTALVIKITHSKPIEIKDFVATMNAVGNLFDGFCKTNGDSSEAQRAKLYVQKIEHGSIEIFLTEAVTALALPFMENVNLVMEFAGHIRNIIQFYTQGKGEKPELSVKELKNYHDVFAITAGDNHGSTEIGAVQIGSAAPVYNGCTFNYYESNSAQNQIQREERQLKETEDTEKLHKRQLMKIFQMRGNMCTNVGNKATIDKLSPKPLSVVFETDELKRQILNNDDNPTKQAYLVDVVIQTIGGKPTAYKVMDLHEIIPLDE
jgi:hypothetical protein